MVLENCNCLNAQVEINQIFDSDLTVGWFLLNISQGNFFQNILLSEGCVYY